MRVRDVPVRRGDRGAPARRRAWHAGLLPPPPPPPPPVARRKHQPGCPCCSCGPICIVVCRDSVVTLTFPDLTTQTRTASATDNRQTICFAINRSGSYTIKVTHERLADFTLAFTSDCSAYTVAYTPTPAPGYHFYFCGDCCLPVKDTLYYSDGTNHFTLTYTDSSSLFPGVKGWEGCGPLETNGCLVTGDCGLAPPQCFSEGADCQQECTEGPALGYVFLSGESCCPLYVISPQCCAPGACGNTCWIEFGSYDACVPSEQFGAFTQPPDCVIPNFVSWQQVGSAMFDAACVGYGVEPPSISCPPAFRLWDPNGQLKFDMGVGLPSDCFLTLPGIVITETAP